MTPADFRSWRARHDLSLTGAANLLAVKRSTIQKWQNGKNKITPQTARMCEMVDALGHAVDGPVAIWARKPAA